MKHRRPKVFVTREIAVDAIAELRRAARVEVWPHPLPPSYAELRRRLRDVDGALTMVTDRIDAALIAASPRLRVVSNLAVGVDNIDLEAATRAGIAIGHTPGVLTDATADLAFALMLAAARRVAQGDRLVRAGKWKTWGPRVLLGPEIFGATLGIIGWGAIGRAMARRASGFQMRVLYVARSRSSRALREKPDGRADRVTMNRLLAESDFVSLHVPLTVATRHLIGAAEFRRMKRGAILINTARGGVIDQRALARAVKSGHLGGAALDVTDPEPIGRDDALLRLDNVVITPHIGSAGYATREKIAALAVENTRAVFEGKIPRWCANPAVRLRPVTSAT
ncbi:MAG: 2-hydroxyacid dehydrogenase [Candidatus Binataceae bacterium]